jgi:hypothetical protein
VGRLTTAQQKRRWEAERRRWERLAADDRRDLGQRTAAAQAAQVCARQLAALDHSEESQRPPAGRTVAGNAGRGRLD